MKEFATNDIEKLKIGLHDAFPDWAFAIRAGDGAGLWLDILRPYTETTESERDKLEALISRLIRNEFTHVDQVVMGYPTTFIGGGGAFADWLEDRGFVRG